VTKLAWLLGGIKEIHATVLSHNKDTIMTFDTEILVMHMNCLKCPKTAQCTATDDKQSHSTAQYVAEV